MNDNRLVKQYSMMDYDLHEIGRTTWCTKIENLLSRYGYNYVRMNQGVGNESLFVFEFTQHVKDSYLQELTESVNKNSKLSLFRNLKIEITPELYLSSIRDRNVI